jgi:hypothetical protein
LQPLHRPLPMLPNSIEDMKAGQLGHVIRNLRGAVRTSAGTVWLPVRQGASTRLRNSRSCWRARPWCACPTPIPVR